MGQPGGGPNSRPFFITVAPTTWLDKHHTIFGQVVEGQHVADLISKLPKDRRDRPLTPVVIKQGGIVEVK